MKLCYKCQQPVGENDFSVVAKGKDNTRPTDLSGCHYIHDKCLAESKICAMCGEIINEQRYYTCEVMEKNAAGETMLKTLADTPITEIPKTLGTIVTTHIDCFDKGTETYLDVK